MPAGLGALRHDVGTHLQRVGDVFLDSSTRRMALHHQMAERRQGGTKRRDTQTDQEGAKQLNKLGLLFQLSGMSGVVRPNV
jgi:hypothetical protein